MGNGLRLGPILRHVTETSATVWVETEAAGTVTVTAGDLSVSSDTFDVYGHHYALCDLTGLRPGQTVAYRVAVDGTPVWPPANSPYPPSLLRTLDPTTPQRLLFGSCRTPTDHTSAAIARYGVDILRAYALRLAEARSAAAGATTEEPTALLLIGDQVYADELQQPMREYLGGPALPRQHGPAYPT